ncbi:hypothetical protein A2442_01480 [Candidatus Campbellbacteria bacterium RIFOXYC2_FULL_35_25]|uniref:Nudix hydrolase domain-containing protein n=1 Tax=Candidatus Campbellbacteria bacterium RIFOXYC2_FULL_35_25 TaxID=1797582 RepID=A0A1F5EH77_9BACT|nr:MAG: hypothetical protein A2442_01480 [Candidatus Campbellbacteria bacterium RIFOXYC2_FULL_35_25]
MEISKDAQAVIFKKNTGRVEFLLLKRYDEERDRTDYRLVKGGIETGEIPEETIIREIKEETGLENLLLMDELEKYSYQAGEILHKVRVFLVENTKNDEIKVDSKNEGGFTIEKAEWVSFDLVDSYLAFEQEKESIKNGLNLIN